MKVSACIFCGGKPLSREHLFPQWLSRSIKAGTPPGFTGEFRASRTIGAGARSLETSTNRYEVTSYCVCKACNETWMSEIENRAKPYIEEMYWGRGLHLGAEAQDAVATWAALKTLVAEHAHPPFLSAFPDAWVREMFVHRRPPKEWIVLVGAFVGTPDVSHSFVQIHDPKVMPGRNDFDPTGEHGAAVTFIVGRLAIKVSAVYKPVFDLPPREVMFRVFPFERDAQWPPPFVFGGDTAERLFGMWLTDGKNEMGTLIRDMNRTFASPGHDASPGW